MADLPDSPAHTPPQHVVAVDVGGTTIKAGRVARDGTLTSSRTIPTPPDVADLLTAVRRTVAECGPTDPVGVVTAGLTDERSGTVLQAANLGWRDLPLRDRLTEALGRPVAFGHDVRGAALAELRWGAGEPDMLFVPIGTGLAVAVVVDGEVRGTGWSGEIGQVLVPDPDGPGRVRLEEIASARGIARRYAARAGCPVDGSREVLRKLEDCDTDALDAVTTAVALLADTLAAASAVLGPVPVVLGGGLAEGGEAVLAPLRAALGERLPAEAVPPVRTARLGRWAGCLGAAAIAFATAEARGRAA
ncbi:ROK family protein [Georgenia alba]|uniref:ROK family protein n=1 Tax=Georgenia alba TaxID=2233858 RepID=A0ABW2Q5M5_9MICO